MFLYDRYNTQYNDPSTGPTVDVGSAWRFETGGVVASSPAIVDETVYIGSSDGTVYALDMVTGSLEWSFQTGGPVFSSPGVLQDTLFVGSNDHSVYALDKQSGKTRWTFETNGKVRSSPTPVNPEYRDSGVVAIGSDDGRMYVIDAATGTEIQHLTTEGAVVSTPFIAEWSYDKARTPVPKIYEVVSTGGDKYFGWLTAFGGRAGDDDIEHPSEYDVGSPTYSSLTGRRVYQHAVSTFWGADDGALYKFTEVNDEHAWKFQTNGKIRGSPAMTGFPGAVYVGSWDHNVYAVDYMSGEKRWAFETGGKVESSPAVAGGVVYVGSGDDHVYAIDTESGEGLWSFRTGGSVFSSPAVVNGTVFVGSNDGHVYALTACQ